MPQGRATGNERRNEREGLLHVVSPQSIVSRDASTAGRRRHATRTLSGTSRITVGLQSLIQTAQSSV